MGNVHVQCGGGVYTARAVESRKKGLMKFGRHRMIRECVSIYYDEPTYQNCLYFLGPDISWERYKELEGDLI